MSNSVSCSSIDLRHLVDSLAPLPSTDIALSRLADLGERHAANLVHVVRRRYLVPSPYDLSSVAASLLQTSGWHQLSTVDRFLSAQPHTWARFTEPQITGGWQHFLEGAYALQRCQAAFNAAWLNRTDPVPLLFAVEAIHAELGKIDLLILGETETGVRVAVCIEAKFGHHVTPGQLADYESKIANRHEIKSRQDRSILLVAPASRPDIRNQLRQKNNEWAFLTWQDWLIRYENALPDKYDDADFQRFRKTTLDRAKLEIDL